MKPLDFTDPFERASTKGIVVVISDSDQMWREWEQAVARSTADSFVGNYMPVRRPKGVVS